MMTFNQWLNDEGIGADSLRKEDCRPAYDFYTQRTVDDLESTIGEVRADREAAHAVCDEVRDTLLDAMGDVGFPADVVDPDGPPVLETAKAAANLIRMLGGGES